MAKTDPDAKPSLAAIANAETTPTEDTLGTACYVDVFKLTDLPDIMDKEGWTVGAALMRRWFAAPAREMSDLEKRGKTDSRIYPSGLVDTTTVTMRWALGFPRIKKAYDEMFGGRGVFRLTPAVFESARAKRQLVLNLLLANKFGLHAEKFGNLKANILNINESWQFQISQPIEGMEYVKSWLKDVVAGDPAMDDMWAALGAFSFKLAGEGRVIPRPGGPNNGGDNTKAEFYEVRVEQVGVYIKDTYDFIGFQYLGHWSNIGRPPVRIHAAAHLIDGKISKGNCPLDYLPIENAHFNEYRKLTNRGGDLMIFSDIHIVVLANPFVFLVSRDEINKIKVAAI